MQPDEPDRVDYVSVLDLADELGIHRVTIWRWLRRLDVPTVVFAGSCRAYIRLADAEAIRTNGATYYPIMRDAAE